MPKINSCNVKNAANPKCCPHAVDVGGEGKYIIKCTKKDRIVQGTDFFPFPEWCPLPIEERKSA